MGWISRIDNVTVSRAGVPVFEEVGLTLASGDKVGVVGSNGAGKSTFLRVIAGREQPTTGHAAIAPGVTVGLLEQEPTLDAAMTVGQVFATAVADTTALLDRFAVVTAALATSTDMMLLDELGRLQTELDRRDAWDLDTRVEQARHALGCPPPQTPIAGLSGGLRRRVALCRVLLGCPQLLLLDEPTNHLDIDTMAWLQTHLAGYPGTVVAVTHDCWFLNSLAGSIIELDRRHAHRYQGNYTAYLNAKAARLYVNGAKDAVAAQRLARELRWAQTDPAARRELVAARLRSYDTLAAAAEHPQTRTGGRIRIPPGPRLGSHVIEASSVGKGFGDRALFTNLSFTLPRNGIVGVLGPNGVGKTTLLAMLAGRQTPDSGTIRIGDSARVVYVDQDRAGLNPDLGVWELVSRGSDHIGDRDTGIGSRAFVAAFGFHGPDQQKPVRALSGGERGRLNLALTLSRAGNVLLLDEPTNDLDTDTLADLEAALEDFPGCVVVTTHDRWFLDRLATHILAPEPDNPGHWTWHDAILPTPQPARADRPARVHRRRLSRQP